MVSAYLREHYLKAAEQWYIDRLFDDLLSAKKIVKPNINQLSGFEIDYLCMLLSGHKPNEIAITMNWNVCSMRTQLSQGLYRYLEEITQEKIIDWRDIIISLNSKGYQKTPKRRVIIIIDDANTSEICEIIERLKQITGDNYLNIIRSESGSLVLVLEGSHQGLETINNLFKNGQLNELIGKHVRDVRYITSDTPFWGPGKFLVNLSQWFQDIFDSGWQTVEAVLGTEDANLNFRFRGKIIGRAKLLELGQQGDIQPVALEQIQQCCRSAEELHSRLITWFNSDEFRPIEKDLRENLNRDDEIRVLIRTDSEQLQKLPWHLWDFFESYPLAEVALSTTQYKKNTKSTTTPAKSKVKILAILGNSEGINIKADKKLLENLPNAETVFLPQKTHQEINDKLWEQEWDIIFFAGHSNTEGETGRIYINKTDSLTIDKLWYALRKAVERGLKLAIFNSCDGLGLARRLDDLHIPQMIIMRDMVPDQVAQEFLKYFLTAFAGGKSFYLAVREAREQLQGLESKFPCATWLPVICQNPAALPPTWEELYRKNRGDSTPLSNKPPKGYTPKISLRLACIISLAITLLVVGMKSLSILETLELFAYDSLMQLQPNSGLDQRILLITVNDDDIRNFEKPLSDRRVNQLLTKLEKYQPRVIGLDIYRPEALDKAKEKDWDNLVKHLQQSVRVVAVCKVDKADSNNNKPPPKIPKERLGFSDAFVPDSDPNNTIRRYVLQMAQGIESPCTTPYSFSFQLVRRYLPPNTLYEFNDQGSYLKIGSVPFQLLQKDSGGYQRITAADFLGKQILIDYRSAAKEISLKYVMNGLDSDLSNLVKDRIVIIGYVGKKTTKDYHSTPLGKMPGVIIHSRVVSQILNVVLEHRRLLSPCSQLGNTLWIWGWSIVGGILAWRFRSPQSLRIAIGVAFAALVGSCFIFFIQSAWVPLIPSALALAITSILVAYAMSQIQQQQ